LILSSVDRDQADGTCGQARRPRNPRIPMAGEPIPISQAGAAGPCPRFCKATIQCVGREIGTRYLAGIGSTSARRGLCLDERAGASASCHWQWSHLNRRISKVLGSGLLKLRHGHGPVALPCRHGTH
jgi:hypothetical protein